MHRVSNNPSNNPMAKVIRTVETIGRAGTDTLHKVGSSGAAKGVETIGRAGTDALRKVGCGAAKGGGGRDEEAADEEAADRLFVLLMNLDNHEMEPDAPLTDEAKGRANKVYSYVERGYL
jgi:hypothetical protein